MPTRIVSHDGTDVAIYATGPMAHLFHRTHEQHYIFHVMAYAASLGEYQYELHPDHRYKPRYEDNPSIRVASLGSEGFPAGRVQEQPVVVHSSNSRSSAHGVWSGTGLISMLCVNVLLHTRFIHYIVI